MQGTRVRALVWEDPTCRGAAKRMSHSYWACASGACAPPQEKPRQWEAHAPRWRVAPARCSWRGPSHRNEDPTQLKINKLKKKILWSFLFLYFQFVITFQCMVEGNVFCLFKSIHPSLWYILKTLQLLVAISNAMQCTYLFSDQSLLILTFLNLPL